MLHLPILYCHCATHTPEPCACAHVRFWFGYTQCVGCFRFRTTQRPSLNNVTFYIRSTTIQQCHFLEWLQHVRGLLSVPLCSWTMSLQLCTSFVCLHSVRCLFSVPLVLTTPRHCPSPLCVACCRFCPINFFFITVLRFCALPSLWYQSVRCRASPCSAWPSVGTGRNAGLLKGVFLWWNTKTILGSGGWGCYVPYISAFIPVVTFLTPLA